MSHVRKQKSIAASETRMKAADEASGEVLETVDVAPPRLVACGSVAATLLLRAALAEQPAINARRRTLVAIAGLRSPNAHR